jgi:formylmethanofuran dehydrogenase subunit A
VAVYAEQSDKAAMFRNAAIVFKEGECVVRDGRVLHYRTGRALTVERSVDKAIEDRMRAYYEETYGLKSELMKVPAAAVGVPEPFECV